MLDPITSYLQTTEPFDEWKRNRVDVETQPGHTGDTTAVKLSMGFSTS